MLSYGSGRNRETDSRLVWFDRSGKVSSVEGPLGAPGPVSFSPDEHTSAVQHRESGRTGDLYLRDLNRGSETRFTFEGTADPGGNVVWSPDGKRVVFSSIYSRQPHMYGKTDLLIQEVNVAG